MYKFYRLLTNICGPFIPLFLSSRKKNGKENDQSIAEKCTTSFSKERSREIKKLLWIHGASIGEAQSSLILVKYLLGTYPELNIMVTTGTLTSAELIKKRLPKRAFHQFCPLDHPKYVEKFLNYWRPDLALWMESELWPNMLHEIKKRHIPAMLINAHMSPKSFKLWSHFPSLSKEILSTFDKILCQNNIDKYHFDCLGALNSIVTDNIKYSAAPLTHNEEDLKNIRNTTIERNICLYASTHDGEEEIACQIHQNLKQSISNLLTIIIPRHPDRRNDIAQACSYFPLKLSFRGKNKNLPNNDDDIYIADTLGELGLFYELSPIAYIGRSLSNDGGGGHNPIEAAQLGCAILHGPNVQNLQDIYTQIHKQNAAQEVKDKKSLEDALHNLLTDKNSCAALQRSALSFAKNKAHVVKGIAKEISLQLDKI